MFIIDMRIASVDGWETWRFRLPNESSRMSCFSKFDVSAQSEQIGRTRTFRKSAPVRPSPDVVARQARISLLAFSAHSERASALAFLNTHSAALRGRPLDIAGRDEGGLIAAIDALNAAQA